MEANPSSLLEIVDESRTKFDDIQAATDYAWQRWRKHSEFDQWVDLLLMRYVRELVYQCRASGNATAKRMMVSPQKVGNGEANSVAVSLILDNVLHGKRIRDMLGTELDEFAEREHLLGVGHLRNENMLRALRPHVADTVKVGQCVSDSKAKRIYKQLKADGAAIPRLKPIELMPRGDGKGVTPSEFNNGVAAHRRKTNGRNGVVNLSKEKMRATGRKHKELVA